MKKLSVIIILAASFSLISCGNIQGNHAADKPSIENDGDKSVTETYKDYNIMSALVLRDFLYQL